MKLYPSWTPSCILGYIPIYSPATHYINKHKPLLGYIGMFKRDIPCISGCISYVIPNWNSSLPGPVPAETLILVPRGHGCSGCSSTALRGTAGHCRLAGGEGQGYLQLSPGEGGSRVSQGFPCWMIFRETPNIRWILIDG